MDRPVITTYIIVTLREEAAGFNPLAALAPQSPPEKDAAKDTWEMLEMECADKHQEQVKEATGKATCATTEDEDGSGDKYRCSVVEEPPSPANDK